MLWINFWAMWPKRKESFAFLVVLPALVFDFGCDITGGTAI